MFRTMSFARANLTAKQTCRTPWFEIKWWMSKTCKLWAKGSMQLFLKSTLISIQGVLVNTLQALYAKSLIYFASWIIDWLQTGRIASPNLTRLVCQLLYLKASKLSKWSSLGLVPFLSLSHPCVLWVFNEVWVSVAQWWIPSKSFAESHSFSLSFVQYKFCCAICEKPA